MTCADKQVQAKQIGMRSNKRVFMLRVNSLANWDDDHTTEYFYFFATKAQRH